MADTSWGPGAPAPEGTPARAAEKDSGELSRLRRMGGAGALALSVASYWAGALPVFHPMSLWHVREPAVTFAAAAVGYAGLIVLVVSWWRLGRLIPSGAAEVRTIVVTLCWWAAPLAFSAPMFSRDVYSYVAQGAMAARGMDVYTAGPSLLGGPLDAAVDALWRDTPAPYGPVFVWLADRVVRVTGDHVLAAVVGMRAIAVLSLAVVAWAVRRLALATRVCQTRALWLSVLNPLVLVHLVGGAHNDAVMLGLMLSGLLLARRGRPALGAVLITLAMLVKAPAGLALLFLVPGAPGGLAGWARRAATVAVAAAVTTVTATAVLGFGYGWLSTLDTPAAGAGVLSLTSDLGRLLGALLRPLGPAVPHTVTTVVGLLGAAAGLAGIGFWLRRMPRLGSEGALGMALLTVVVLAPAVQPWYFLWGLLPVAATVADERARRIFAAASVSLLFVAFLRGQAVDVAYGLCCFTGVALALLAFYRLDPVPGSRWRRTATPRRRLRHPAGPDDLRPRPGV